MGQQCCKKVQVVTCEEVCCCLLATDIVCVACTGIDLCNREIRGVPCRPRCWRLPPPPPAKEYPELRVMPEMKAATANVGLALSGGGIRATCEGLGVLMWLHERGMLPHVRYVSSNSGGSWVNAPMCFLPEQWTVDEFLAPGPLPPTELSMQKLGQIPARSMMEACAKATPGGACLVCLCNEDCLCLDCCGRGTRYQSAWNEAVTLAYLGPFNLDVAGSVMSTPAGTEGHQRALEAVKATGADVLPQRRGMPFMIINAALNIGRNPSKQMWSPLEFTPLYVGIPALIEEIPGGVVGGGVVEAFGANSLAPAALPGGRTAVSDGEEVPQEPSTWLSLDFAMGTSSAAVAQAMRAETTGLQNIEGGSVMNQWSLADIHSGNNGLTSAADGGGVDNTGVVALLRRNVQTIISELSTTAAVTSFDPAYVTQVWWPSLFGAASGSSELGVNDDQINRQNQVFDSDRWPPLLQRCIALANAGKPVVVTETYTVRTNALAGVVGGWRVKVIWVVNSLSEEFVRLLPQDTQKQLQEDPLSAGQCCPLFPMSDFKISRTFPYPPTTFGGYSPSLCSLLAQNLAFNMNSAEDELRSAFRGFVLKTGGEVATNLPFSCCM